MKRPTLIVLLLGIAFAGAALLSAAKTEMPKNSAVDVSGVWNVTVKFAGVGGHPVFTFKQNGDKLTGSYAGAFGDADVTGTIKCHDIRFEVRVAAQSVHETYVGTVEGDTMQGKFTLAGMGDGSFTGTRQARK